MAAGGHQSAGLRPDGSIETWGKERYFGPNEIRPGPYVQAHLGHIYGCGLLADGQIDCWGCGDEFEGNLACEPPEGTFVELDAGAYAGCARDESDLWHCWGTITDVPIPDTVFGPFIDVEVCSHVLCGIVADGTEPVCWSINPNPNQLPPPGLALSRITGGLAHMCGIEPDGSAVCWGRDVTLVDPYPQLPEGTYLEIDSSENITCALRTDQTLACVIGPFFGATIDVTPPEGVTFSDFSVGARHVCGLTTEGEILCWGHEIAGELAVPQ